jgi:hypothetical protein
LTKQTHPVGETTKWRNKDNHDAESLHAHFHSER